MTMRATLLIGFAALAVYLAVVITTEGIGFGDDGRGRASWPNLVEDSYDRQAYQQRGRWIVSGGRPYLDEFSEYPQITTWLMGLPYLFMDHNVRVGEPFGAKARARDLYREAGLEASAEGQFRRFVRTPYSEEMLLEDDQLVVAPARALSSATAVSDNDARGVLTDAWREIRAFADELKRNASAYGDIHQVLMALWFALLFVLSVAILRQLGHGPTSALLLLLPAALFFGFNRFDAVVTAMMALALFFHLREWRLLSAFVLGVAVMTKWFPIALVPIFFSHDLQRYRATSPGLTLSTLFVRTWIVPGLVTTSVIVVCLGTTWFWGEGGLPAVQAVFDWHANVRVPNKSSLLMVLTSEQQWGLIDSSHRDTLEKTFKVLQLLPGLLLAFLPLRGPRALVLACLTATLAAVTFSEFFSPQWILWTTAFSLLLAPAWRRFGVLTVLLDVLLWFQMFFHSHAYAARLLDGQSNPTWEPYWQVHYLRTAVMLVFLLVALVTLLGEVRRRAD